MDPRHPSFHTTTCAHCTSGAGAGGTGSGRSAGISTCTGATETSWGIFCCAGGDLRALAGFDFAVAVFAAGFAGADFFARRFRFASAAISAAADSAQLEELRVLYLGRKSELTTILRGIADLPAEERGPVGGGANQARQELEAQLESRAADLDAAELEEQLVEDRIDVTLPGAPPRPVGHTHLITRTTWSLGKHRQRPQDPPGSCGRAAPRSSPRRVSRGSAGRVRRAR